jgi:hypothetical protein
MTIGASQTVTIELGSGPSQVSAQRTGANLGHHACSDPRFVSQVSVQRADANLGHRARLSTSGPCLFAQHRRA